MILSKQMTGNSGVILTTHRIRKLTLNEVDEIILSIESWMTEADYTSGKAAIEEKTVRYKPTSDFLTAVSSKLSEDGILVGCSDISSVGKDLDTLKANKIADLRNRRESKIAGGFTYAGNLYDSDSTAQSRILGAFISNGEYLWRTADNQWVSLTAEGVAGLWGSLQVHIRECFVEFANKELLVNAAVSEEDLAVI